MDQDSRVQSTQPVSVIDSLSQAIVWSRDVLFRPFDVGKWFVLGFGAWLAGLGERGGGPNGSSHWQQDGRHGDFERGLREAGEWVLAHLFVIATVVTVVVVIGITIWLLVLWLSSRGKFVFLDGVVHNRAAVVVPWHRFRAPANALFRFRVVVGLLCGAIVVGFLAFVAFLVWTGVEAHDLAPLLVTVGIVALLLFVAAMIGFSLIGCAINDFVVPLIYLRGGGVAAAWRELGSLVAVRPGAFILYVLARILIAAAVTVIGILSCCATCCIVLLPYIGTVILLPICVFVRAFPLYFLGQFGPRYARFARLGPDDGAEPSVPPPSEPEPLPAS